MLKINKMFRDFKKIPDVPNVCLSWLPVAEIKTLKTTSSRSILDVSSKRDFIKRNDSIKVTSK